MKRIFSLNSINFTTVPSSGHLLVMHFLVCQKLWMEWFSISSRGNTDTHSVWHYYYSLNEIHLLLFFLFSDHGLHSLPLQQKQLFLARRDGSMRLPSHRPLERTRSEPPPYSHSPLILPAAHQLHAQHHLSQPYAKSFQERFKQNIQLSKVKSNILSDVSNVFFFSIGWFLILMKCKGTL